MKFQISFINKEWNKQVTLESQDEKVAKQWAEKQLECWGKKARITVTAIHIQEPVQEKKEEPKKVKKGK